MKITLIFLAAFVTIAPSLAQTPDPAPAGIELPDQRTYFSKTYYNAKDNTYTAHISAGYIHYQTSDGSYKEIDTKLRADAEGGYLVENGLYQVRFRGDAGQTSGDDVVYDLPRPIHPRFRDPGSPPAPPTKLRWKILNLGYFDQQSKRYQVIENAKSVTPVVAGNEISYVQAFNGIDVKYTCRNTRLKEELVLSQKGRDELPDPGRYGISRANAYLMFATEFALTPNNINVYARATAGRVPVRQGNAFAFEGDDPIDFEDDDANLHFFFPMDYAWAVNDSASDFAGRVSVKRYFYSDRGKHYLLIGVPWSWINTSPAGTLIIDPTTSVATSEDVWLEGSSNKDANSAGLIVGKVASFNKKRTIIKFNIAGSGIPTSATVLNAQMKLYYYGTGGSGWVDRWLQAHQILVNWNEAQATSVNRLTSTPWNVAYVGLNDIDAKSGYESTLLFYLVDGQQVYGWKNWDLTGLTQKWVNGTATNYGVVLWATNETTDAKDLRFYSSEAAAPNDVNRPYLQVTYSTTAKTVYFLKDHLGSIRATVQDSTGVPVRGYDDYDPGGYILAGRSMASSILPSNATRNKFTGKEFDDEFGVNYFYFGARYYDAQIGRWMVRDQMARKYPSLSPYNYAANNPLKYVDPDGKKIRLAGTPAQRQFAFNLITQNLTRIERANTGIKYDTNLKEYRVVTTKGYQGASKAFSYLREVVNADKTAEVRISSTLQEKGRTINLQTEAGGGATQYPGGSPVVTISPQGSTLLPEVNPLHIIMAHELFGHARLQITGGKEANTEEAATQVEDEIRKEQGLPSKKESQIFLQPETEVKPKKEKDEEER